MSILKKVKAVEKLYHSLDHDIAQFSTQTGLSCFAGCGACCQKADIEATPLEMLPFAYACMLDEKAEEVLEMLQAQPSPYCYLLKLSVNGGSGGLCAQYNYRALICRLFGYAAARDKYGSLRLITCNIIKEQQAATYTESMEKIKAGLAVPVMSHYYSRLNGIDQELSRRFYSINQAMAIALKPYCITMPIAPGPGSARSARLVNNRPISFFFLQASRLPGILRGACMV
jgi:uncharacterized protein